MLPFLCRRMAISCTVITAALLTTCGDRGPQPQPSAQQAPAPAASATATPAGATLPASTASTGKPCPNPPPCGSNCSNTPFAPTDCYTTQYWPAKADVIVKPTNLLYCNGGTYALCFFSGPPNPTGKNPATNKPLPCTLQGSVANCTCQAYNSGAYFVDINGILNLGAYYQTVNACGQDGSGCDNLETCGPDGGKSGCGTHPAPVCQYVKNQKKGDASGSLIPGADLISTFSFAMDNDYKLGSTCCAGLYAGCMTAPCHFAPGKTSAANGDPVQCECPVADGNFQIGQSDQSCKIASSGPQSYVWSASFSVSPPPHLPAGSGGAGKNAGKK